MHMYVCEKRKFLGSCVYSSYVYLYGNTTSKVGRYYKKEWRQKRMASADKQNTATRLEKETKPQHLNRLERVQENTATRLKAETPEQRLNRLALP